MKLPYRSGRTPSVRRNHTDNNELDTPAAAAGKGKGKSKAPTTTTSMMDDRNHDDLDSSPAMPAPELHSEIFGTPARRKQVPGVSVLTPARNKKAGGGLTPGRKPPFSTKDSGLEQYVKKETLWDDSDSDGEEGMMSPPKTMQFHVPQSKLLRTPAREASKKIVEDLLLTAGGNVTDEFDEEASPSVVKRTGVEDDDTF
ncbi:MAG: hypothetical protein Q9183_001195 [Haloplaca sp. 2 TL-2023]